MRNTQVRKIRQLAYLTSEAVDKEGKPGRSQLVHREDGSVCWVGFRRIFRDMKRAYRKGTSV